MKTFFLDKKTTYNGKQLRPHWIFETAGLIGDAIVAFTGPADVPTSNMVDLKDVKDNAPIFSKDMLHFIVEHFNTNLELAVLRQRLLVAIANEEITLLSGKNSVVRRNDDLYSADKKLSVSIATASTVSTLIHFAMNIDATDAPVAAIGLNDLKIDAKKLADNILERYSSEVSSMYEARCKVRAV